MNRSTSEVMRNSRPIKMDENMRNIKVEGDNSFSFVSTFFSVLGRIMINKAAFNILEYCDGDNSVQDICHLLNTKYDIDEDIIYKDVDKTLQLFWRLKVIKMTGENYLLDRFVYISDKLKIKYLQYEELLDLVSNIDSLKDSLVIAEEGLGLLNNENILKLVWSSGIISGFSMEDNNGNVAKIIIQPNIKYKIFEIIYIEDEDKLPERWTNILISFMKKLYRETLEAKTLVEDRLIMKDMYNIAMDIHEVLEKETQNINMLSGGEKQKVELVKTILKDADVYFFDEPTAHLDQESRDEYYQYLKKQKDKIIVVVSHNSQERQYFDVIYEV